MPDGSEQRIARLRGRLASSRAQLFALVHVMKGDPNEAENATAAEQGVNFPHSHTMRVLLGKPGRLALGGAAVALALLRPKLLWRAARFTPMLRPLLMRYILPRLLGEH